MGVLVKDQETVLKGGFFLFDGEWIYVMGHSSDRHSTCPDVQGRVAVLGRAVRLLLARIEPTRVLGDRGCLPSLMR